MGVSFMNPLAPQANFMGTPSVYGMPMGGMSGMSMLGGGASGSQLGGAGGFAGAPGMAPPMALGMQQRPLSTFSLATTMNPFAGGPNMSENPTDDELFSALRAYLSTQDLMTVTKKTAREAIMAKFPKADLTPRKDFLNQSIDKILSES